MHIKKAIIVGLLILMQTGAIAETSKVSGVTFMHYSFEDTDNNGFQINRAYLTYENRISETLSYKFQLDVGKDDVSAYSAYLKTAKVDWKTDLGKWTAGLQTMNMFKVQENTWGYRFIEKSAMDLGKFSSSADLGIGWVHDFGPVHSSVMITNGAGYKKAEDDGHKKISTRFHLGEAKLKEGQNVGVVTSFEGLDYGTESTGSSLVIGGFAGMVAGPATIGAEYNMKTVSKATKSISNIVSAYGRIKAMKGTELFVRVDHSDPDTDIDQDAVTYLIAGGVYQPAKGLTIAPNVRVELPELGDEELIYYLNFQFKY